MKKRCSKLFLFLLAIAVFLRQVTIECPIKNILYYENLHPIKAVGIQSRYEKKQVIVLLLLVIRVRL
ncbi:hypothetical protein COI83_26395 [Bacillus cereus]|nr:hypothetical protein COI83_26395 [Bacillus cereus]